MLKYTLKSWFLSQLGTEHTLHYIDLENFQAWNLTNMSLSSFPTRLSDAQFQFAMQSIKHKSRIQGLTCNNFRPTSRTSDVRSDLTKANATVAKMCTSPAFSCTKQTTRANLATWFRVSFPIFFTEETHYCLHVECPQTNINQSLERIYCFLNSTTTISTYNI